MRNLYGNFSMFDTWFLKKYPSSVLANPYFLDWRVFGQNMRYLLFCLFLQRCRTSGALSKYNYSIFIILNLFSLEIPTGRVVIYDFDPMRAKDFSPLQMKNLR